MSAPKTVNAWGFMAKVQAAYGTPETLAAGSDGVLLLERPEIDLDQFVHDGSRGRVPGGATRMRVAQSGRFGTASLVAEMIGSGAAYSGSVFPSLHRLLQGCGLQATLDATPGSEKYTYAPETGPSGLDALTMEGYLAGMLKRMYDAYGTFEITADGPVVPRWDFSFSGRGDAPTDVAIPTITSYPPASRLPPKAENIAFTLGLFTGGVVRSFHFLANREHDAARTNLNSGGHAGFTPGGRNPILEVVLEQPVLTTGSPWSAAGTLNPYKLAEEGSLHLCSLQIGSTQFNRWKLFAGSPTSAAQAKVIEVEEGEDGPTAIWTLRIEFYPSTYLANDEFSIVTD